MRLANVLALLTSSVSLLGMVALVGFSAAWVTLLPSMGLLWLFGWLK